MTDRSRPRRRTVLGLSVTALAGLAGCGATAGATADPSPRVAPDRPPCAAGFRIVDREARIEKGTVPDVTFHLRNDGDVAVDYELRVEFEQGTSLGRPVRTGRDAIEGTLAPGAAAAVTATDDAYEVGNTTGYALEVTLDCAGATGPGEAGRTAADGGDGGG
jgi:hypothetical protein